MQFCHEKESRHFFWSVIFCAVLCALFSGVIFLTVKNAAGQMSIRQAKLTASYLLEQGMDPVTAAEAVTNDKMTEEGEALVEKAGFSKSQYLPAVSEVGKKAGAILLINAAVLILLIVGQTSFFLYKRERLYQQAYETVRGFLNGDYAAHLPRLSEGSLYRLFGEIDKLANVLQSQKETEHKAKEFLKDTISDISHQLKTPLAALRMYNEIISEEPENGEMVLEFSKKTDTALGRMEQLIGMMLKITRLDTGSIVFEQDHYPVSEVVEKAVQNLRTRAECEGKILQMRGGEETIYCDLQWTSEAVSNLVKNALDHTENGGVILISWEETPGMLRLSVADDGAGICQEDYHHIFKRFYRSRNSLPSQGIGLGLPFAKSVTEGQGGTISVRSVPGEGTEFTISFTAPAER